MQLLDHSCRRRAARPNPSASSTGPEPRGAARPGLEARIWAPRGGNGAAATRETGTRRPAWLRPRGQPGGRSARARERETLTLHYWSSSSKTPRPHAICVADLFNILNPLRLLTILSDYLLVVHLLVFRGSSRWRLCQRKFHSGFSSVRTVPKIFVPRPRVAGRPQIAGRGSCLDNGMGGTTGRGDWPPLPAGGDLILRCM